ncbi:glucose dehydrogenase [FAD, quinone]-like [Mytilus californianus]|uniref:glucose dehydrogenase [FAD, quinone]-like n=1 Tax=Mytilus californianus TaxID=6549 RepID=UPI002247A8A6|nr:glucose dehydrogenase [FAD, quinone]-like [Mytilus californianus]
MYVDHHLILILSRILGDHVMFLGQSLVQVASLVNFLSTVLPPTGKDSPGVFDRPLEECYDYIVVGAGSAGGIVATRLSEGSDKILLLEAGGSDIDDDLTKIPLLWSAFSNSNLDWKFKTIPQMHSHFANKDKVSNWPRGKCLGGTGKINAMALIRGNPKDFAKWTIEGAVGWSYSDVLPFFKKIENIDFNLSTYNEGNKQNLIDLTQEQTEAEEVCISFDCKNEPEKDLRGRNGPLTIVESRMTMLEYFHEQAAQELGFNRIDCNSETQLGFCRIQVNIKKGERCDTASCYLRPALERTNLQVHLNSHVSKILFEGKVAQGVEFSKDGILNKVYARKEIILSAGVVGSPKILLLSGIGPKQHLNDIGIPVVVDLPVGENVQDQMAMHFQVSINMSLATTSQKMMNTENILQYLFFREGIYAQIGVDGMVFVNLDQNNEEPPDIQLIFLGLSYDKGFLDSFYYKEEVKEELAKRTDPNSFVVIMNLLHAKSRGTITLSTTSSSDKPVIDPMYLSDSDDVETFVKGIRFLQKLQETKSWKSIGATLIRHDTPGHCSEEEYDEDNYWRCMVRHFANQANHQTSSCRMGLDDETAVVDPQLR